MGMLDRRYTAREVAEVAYRGTKAMEQGGVPGVVMLAAHVGAASVLLEDAMKVGPLSQDFQDAARVLDAVSKLFLLVCDTGPVSAGTKQ